MSIVTVVMCGLLMYFITSSIDDESRKNSVMGVWVACVVLGGVTVACLFNARHTDDNDKTKAEVIHAIVSKNYTQQPERKTLNINEWNTVLKTVDTKLDITALETMYMSTAERNAFIVKSIAAQY